MHDSQIQRRVHLLNLRIRTLLVVAMANLFLATLTADAQIRIATFNVDASPPIGSPLAYDPTLEIQSPLSCRGVVILSDQKPIVLCVIDWLGVANSAQTEFKEAFAAATGTTTDRIAIHAVHQHDAPRCDITAENTLVAYGEGGKHFDLQFIRQVIGKAAAAIKINMALAQKVTHLGHGMGKVDKVASNRRILGKDGKVKVTRYTATRDPNVRAMPVGTIDPMLRALSFWNEDKCLAVLTFYATHPQSYYRTGKANPDFPGLARNSREKETGIPHIHFNGAGGNIGAGKWNDGSVKNRAVLAKRVEDGMKLAFENTTKKPVDAGSLRWEATTVELPLGKTLKEEVQIMALENEKETDSNKLYAAKHLSWIYRTQTGQGVPLSCLHLNKTKTLFVPGELFVEYQLEAQEMDKNSFVSMAAYGEYGMGYIGTAVSYSQGGYESSPRASRVGPGSEKILMDAFKKLLK